MLGFQTNLEASDRQSAQEVDLAISQFRSHHRQILNFPNSSYVDDIANFHSLVTACRIPPVFVSRLGAEGRRQLLIRLSMNSDTIPSFEAMPKLLVVDVQNGLGNRLRALASALEFSYLTRRVLVVVWAADAHLNASIHHLFDQTVLRNLVLIQTPIPWPINPHNVYPSSPLTSTTAANQTYESSVSYFNFMAKDSKSKRSPLTQIPDSSDQHIYVRTAYVLRSQYAPGTLINAFFQALTPAPKVQLLCDRAQRAAGGEDALHTMIGVHIRSRTLAHDNERVDYQCEYSVQGAAVTNQWRSRSAPKNFIAEMKRMRREWPKVVRRSLLLTSKMNDITHGRARYLVDTRRVPKFFASVDTTSALNELYKQFPRKHIVTLPRNCDDRDAECVQYAFADMILLSRTGAMLASGWSSFSEAAQRLRVRPADIAPWRNDGYIIRTSGIDFGWTWEERLRAKILQWISGRTKHYESFASEKEREQVCSQKRIEHDRQHNSTRMEKHNVR
ncbi:hypothetical protein FGB62_59g119 [Gracilaria domingensis]|nr:hypothetical protein FGB62_59g119 [Gracilaria domingensis]